MLLSSFITWKKMKRQNLEFKLKREWINNVRFFNFEWTISLKKKKKKKYAEGEEKHKVQEELEEEDETDIAQRKWKEEVGETKGRERKSNWKTGWAHENKNHDIRPGVL